MEQGKIENWQDIRELALMSIGTNKGTWWADTDFGCELWKLKQTGKVNGATVETARRMILESLSWLKQDGLAKDINCIATQSGKNSIAWVVQIYRPNGETISVEDSWNVI